MSFWLFLGKEIKKIIKKRKKLLQFELECVKIYGYMITVAFHAEFLSAWQSE